MFIISGGKGTGKTKALLEKAKAENGIVVCENESIMRQRAYDYGITGLEIISYDTFCPCELYISDKPIYIHDINKFLNFCCSDIKGYTVNLD